MMNNHPSTKDYLFELFVSGKLRPLFLILIFAFITAAELRSQDDNSGYEDISVLVRVDGYGSFYLEALYSPDELLYIPVEAFFNYLKIPCNVANKGDNLTGFLGNENNNYELSFRTGILKTGNRQNDVKQYLVKEMGSMYLESSLFGPLTGIKLDFNFRSLYLTVKPDFELPLVKEQRLAKMRSGMAKDQEEKPADTVLGRNYHLFRFGTADWSVSSSQYSDHHSDTRLGLGAGAELMGGEADLYLNYSELYGLDKRLQQYLWRWVDNDKKYLTQIQVGKISTRTISSLYHPVIGAEISNAPTTIRKAKGVYIIKEVTQPGWLVELYINNSLVDFVKADAAGLFMFKVPLVYGYTTLMLKYYGPMGEERSETKTINIPYSFLPAGEIEYRVSGGFLEDGKRTPIGRGEATMGVSRFLTLGVGTEYMASVKTGQPIPFVTASVMPISKIMIFGEYDHGVRFKGLMNYYPGANSIMELEYTRYQKGQEAILYNYLEERKATFSLPLRVKAISGFVRLGYKQNVYSNLNYNMSEMLVSSYYKQFNLNLSTYANWVSDKPAYLNSMLALSYRLKKGITLRTSTHFSYTSPQVLSYKVEAEKLFLHNGHISVSYENYTKMNTSSVNLNFKYDLKVVQTNASARIGRGGTSTFQNVRGSLAFGRGRKKVHASELSTVGRGGISIIAFVDTNHNGVFDKHEHKAKNLNVKINGGRINFSEKDTMVNVLGLEPFIRYNLDLDDRDFENVAWRINKKTYDVLIDPNQFKVLYVPVVPVGGINGTVSLERDGITDGIGRILINFYNRSGVKVASTQSESDGYFEFLGLEPGEFTARIDSVQLSRLDYYATPSEFAFAMKATEDGDIADNINFKLVEISRASDTTIVEKPMVNTDSVNKNELSTDIVKPTVVVAANTITTDPADPKPVIDISPDTLVQNEMHFYVQTGAFRLLSKARKHAAELAETITYPSGIVVGEGFYKTTIGYFKTKAEAEACKESLKKSGMISFIGQSLYYGYQKNQNLKSGAYYVGVGSFRDKKNAIDYSRKVNETGSFETGIILEEGLYKVRLGYFENRNAAKACMEEAIEKGLKAVVGESESYIYSGTLVPEIK